MLVLFISISTYSRKSGKKQPSSRLCSPDRTDKSPRHVRSRPGHNVGFDGQQHRGNGLFNALCMWSFLVTFTWRTYRASKENNEIPDVQPRV
ncbi:hypothetical protein CesoFtcFv8_019029 [Champsocephalus esox]|uniref:Uncharacterized protein n=1 Tax=Champsocephalus esox TaxID=159716 RepID=A0AAN8BHG6_9TELE|nr:hypothetical protein CesoFtcFv8_019029 [Champsocephalus esox]